MMKLNRLPALLIGALATFSIGASASALGTHIYAVTIDPSQEVPPPVSSGIGTATVTLDDVTGLVTVAGTFSGLTSNASAAHLHGLAGPGALGGVLISLTETGGTSGNVTGSGTLSAANVTGMLNGLTYLNIHTTNNPGGEIRGQIVQEVPSLSAGWLVALAVLAVAGAAFVLARRPGLATA